MPSKRRGFSLVELLVVIGIVVALISLIVPAIQKVRAAADRVRCANNLRQIGYALHLYHDDHRRLPPGVSVRNGRDPFLHMSWLTRLLPYIEQQPLWRESVRAFAQDRFFRNDPPHTAIRRVIRLYACPADDRALKPMYLGRDQKTGRDVTVAFTSYLGVTGANRSRHDGVLFIDSAIRFAAVRDGMSTTVFVGERPPSADGNYGWWYGGWGQIKDGSCDSVLSAEEENVAPRYQRRCPRGPYFFRRGRIDDQCSAFHFWSVHPGGGHFLFGDNSVHFLSYSARSILPALATRAGYEVVELP